VFESASITTRFGRHRGISYLAAGCGGSAFFDRSTFFDVDACSRKDLFGFEMADFVVRLFEKLSV
jgi:hypothetical protein